MLSYQRILHPTDFSEGVQHAQKYAIGFAAGLGAELYVLHVVTPQNLPSPQSSL